MLPCEDLKTKWVANWRPDFIGTLVFLVCHSEILLIRKKTGHGRGQINVPGGKIEPGEVESRDVSEAYRTLKEMKSGELRGLVSLTHK